MKIKDDDQIEVGDWIVSGKEAKEILYGFLGVTNNHFSAMFYKDGIITGKIGYVTEEKKKRMTK